MEKEETVHREGSVFLLHSCARFAAGAERGKSSTFLMCARVAGNCALVARMCAHFEALPVSSRKAAALFKTLTALRKVFSKGASIPLRSSLPVG